MIEVISQVLSRLNRIDRLVWHVRQPLTKKPSDPGSVVSDLFLWRKGQGWRTFFELTDIASLFGRSSESNFAKVIIFDQTGGLIGERKFTAPRYARLQVDISELATPCRDDVGTFCVLHQRTPDIIGQGGSNLAERGYVSYCYRGSSLRSYVHGNLDVISNRNDGGTELLAGTSFLTRKFFLQRSLNSSTQYDLAVVNASRKVQKVVCNLFREENELTNVIGSFSVKSMNDAVPLCRFEETLRPGASHVFRLPSMSERNGSCRVVIASKLVMLRPLVFQLQGDQLDVFHG